MTMTMAMTREQAGAARRAAYEQMVDGAGSARAQNRAATLPMMTRAPSDADRRREVPFASTLRLSTAPHPVSGKDMLHLEGFATIYNKFYEMWDFFGPYEEQVSDTAMVMSLAQGPDVAFLVNHKGVTMARTIGDPPTLYLSNEDREDGEKGLKNDGWLNPKRTDVKDLGHAIEDGNITEMSFAFMLLDGRWSEDFMKFTITEADINRGDVSAVNYGANPYTSIAARSNEILQGLQHMPPGAAREALRRLSSRDDVAGEVVPETPPAVQTGPIGRTLASVEALLED